VGIAPDKLPSLFEPFRQAEDSTARRYGGTGLGLSLCRRLSRAMNGDIDVSSRPGSGSTFRVWLELKRSAASLDFADTQPMENANDDALLRGRRVLVADDNTISQKLLTRWLEQEGVIVELVANGEDAVRRARQGGLDMILMDLSMPVMDGFDATRTIRAFLPAPGGGGAGRPPSAVPIIGVTARAMPGDRDACIRSGMDGYVTKPLKRNELIRTMASAVSGEARAPAPARAPKASA
jgi:CheY-like chemotaxis protein